MAFQQQQLLLRLPEELYGPVKSSMTAAASSSSGSDGETVYIDIVPEG